MSLIRVPRLRQGMTDEQARINSVKYRHCIDSVDKVIAMDGDKELTIEDMLEDITDDLVTNLG